MRLAFKRSHTALAIGAAVVAGRLLVVLARAPAGTAAVTASSFGLASCTKTKKKKIISYVLRPILPPQ